MEDLQPNEARLARKGNTAVPRVRSTVPRPHHPSRGSNGRGRGRGHSNFSHRQNFASPKPRPFSQNTLPQDTPSFHSTPAQPHHTPRYPPFRNPPSIPTYTSSGDAKRRRIHPDGPTRAENWRSAAATSSNKTPLLPGNDIAEILARPPSKVRHKKHKSYPSIEIMLPPNCRKGVVNCKNERGNWLARLKIAMSTERKTVLHSDFSEKSVKLVYREEEGSDDSANAGPVPVEQTPLSLTSGRSEPTSVFSHTPAATLSQPSSVKPEPEPEISSKSTRDPQDGTRTDSAYQLNVQTAPPESARSSNHPLGQHKRKRYHTPVMVGTGTAYGDPIDLTENVPETQPLAFTPRPHQFMFKSGSLTVKAPAKQTSSAARSSAMSEIEQEPCNVPVLHEQQSSELRHRNATFRSDTLRVESPSENGLREAPRNDQSSVEDLSTFPTPQLLPQKESSTARQVSVDCSLSQISGGPSAQRGAGISIPTSDDSGALPLDRASDDPQLWQTSRLPKVMPPDRRLRVRDMVRLPRDGQGCRDKTRRILLLPEQSSVLCASHHGFLERFDATPLRRRSAVQLPPAPTHAFVEDACIVSLSSGPHVILGHARDEQEISVVPLSGRREATSMSRIPHGGVKGGTSTVCAMSQPCMFASGGHDHSVHLWKIVEDWNAENDLRGSARRLAIKHVSVVQSLLPLLDTSHKLVSASADCSVQLYDLASERAVNTVRTSNSPFHVHNAPMPFCVLLEVGHRETQFELRDYRLVPERPVARFGYPTEKIQGRFVKGDLQENLFACGDTEGTVRVWDIRASSKVLSSIDVFAGQKVVHVTFSGPSLYAASGDNRLVFMGHV